MISSKTNFLEAIAAYRELYQALDIRIIAGKMYDGWVNMATNITFEIIPVNEADILNNLPCLDQLQAFHLKRPFSDLEVTINELLSGRLVVRNVEIQYGRATTNQARSPLSFCYRSYSRNSRFNSAESYKEIRLEEHFGEPYNSILGDKDKFDSLLCCLDVPFDGLSDFHKSFLNYNLSGDYNKSAHVLITAPTYIRFSNECHFEGNNLRVEIETPSSARPSLIRLGIIEHAANGSRKRYSLPIGSEAAVEDNTKYILNITAGQCLYAEAFLVYNNDLTDRLRIYSSEGLLSQHLTRLYSYFDPSLRTLQNLIAGEGQGSKDFELGICLLFGLAGFVCQPVGLYKPLNHVPDGIALIPNASKAILYECSLDLSDRENKLLKLSKRTKELHESAPEFEIIPAFFTNLPRRNIVQSEISKAAVETIAMVGKESIEEILDSALIAMNAEEIFNQIQQLVPIDYRYQSRFGIL